MARVASTASDLHPGDNLTDLTYPGAHALCRAPRAARLGQSRLCSLHCPFDLGHIGNRSGIADIAYALRSLVASIMQCNCVAVSWWRGAGRGKGEGVGPTATGHVAGGSAKIF